MAKFQLQVTVRTVRLLENSDTPFIQYLVVFKDCNGPVLFKNLMYVGLFGFRISEEEFLQRHFLFFNIPHTFNHICFLCHLV